MKRRLRKYSGVKSPEVSQRELKHREIAGYAATQGFVLLKNEDLLPISQKSKVFLAGTGAVQGIKGGTGSGDVNEREVVDILTGLKNREITVVNEREVLASIADYKDATSEYVGKILSNMTKISSRDFFEYFLREKKRGFKRVSIDEGMVKPADIVIYVISRIAGEGRDRTADKNDYYLSDTESSELEELGKLTDRIVVLLNVGGPIDLNEILNNKSVKAIMNISQPGMELGNAVADVLIGKVSPSGKLSATWARAYKDYPSVLTFSPDKKNPVNERYEEGIYVGYRYFDSFDIKPAYPFGFGLSYTDFKLSDENVNVAGSEIRVKVKVTNTGDKYSGREVVQVYAACPQANIKKEFKRLAGFKKTALINPGESEMVEISVNSKSLASFDEKRGAWVLECGEYAVFVGNSSENTVLAGVISIKEDFIIEKTQHILTLC